MDRSTSSMRGTKKTQPTRSTGLEFLESFENAPRPYMVRGVTTGEQTSASPKRSKDMFVIHDNKSECHTRQIERDYNEPSSIPGQTNSNQVKPHLSGTNLWATWRKQRGWISTISPHQLCQPPRSVHLSEWQRKDVLKRAEWDTAAPWIRRNGIFLWNGMNGMTYISSKTADRLYTDAVTIQVTN